MGKTLTFEAKYLGRGWGSDLGVLQLQTSLRSRSGASKWNPALRTHEPCTLRCLLCLPRWGRGVSRSCFKEMIYICVLRGVASQSESALIKSPWNLDTAIASFLSCVHCYGGFIALASQYLAQWQKCWKSSVVLPLHSSQISIFTQNPLYSA